MVSELVSRPQHASEAGTRRFVERHGAGKAADAYRTVHKLQLSTIGIGTYLGRPDDASDAEYVCALVEAVRLGVNVIDTASNYRQRRSERAVGVALQQLFAMGEVHRSELFIVSKAGFVPMDRGKPEDPLAYFRSRTIGRGLAREDELRCGCHCIAPGYLRATLEESLHELGLPMVDAYLIHNPESQLQELDRASFLDRMRRAFEAMERAADDGLVRNYGVSTWPGLRAARADRDYLSLRELWALAEDVGGVRHRFRAIEVPVNLHLPEAHTLANQDGAEGEAPLLRVAADLGMVVLGSAALGQGKLARHDALPAIMPEAHALPEGIGGAVHSALQFARSAPGVTTALVGMSKVVHVYENTRALGTPLASRAWVDAIVAPRGAAIQR